MLYILDTDHLTLIQRQSQPAFAQFLMRRQQRSNISIVTTIISFHEQAQGWLGYLNKQGKKPAELLYGYAELFDLLLDYGQSRVLPFDKAAYERFVDLQQRKVRLSTMDLRIAAITLSTGAVLLSRNLRDYRKVPGLLVEDWTVPIAVENP